MRPVLKKRCVFIAKSMLWSLLLYVALMFAFNWDEVSNTVNGKNAITVVSNTQPAPQAPGAQNPAAAPARISAPAGIVRNILSVVKAVTGIARVSAAL